MNDKKLNCMDCFYYEIKYGIGYYCNLDNKPLGELGCMNDICINFKLAVYTEIDVSGTGWETEIKNRITGKQYGVKGCVKLLNELYYKKEDLKDLLMNSEPVVEQKELQKIIYKIIRDLINEKLVEGNKNYEKQFTEAKIKNISDEKYQKDVSIILDTVFYWKGYVKALEDLKKELDVV